MASSVVFFILGIVLLFWAAPLSRRYNAWTTAFREHNPNINPPPTPEWRGRNTIIFSWILRLLGLSFVVMDGLALIGYYLSRSK